MLLCWLHPQCCVWYIFFASQFLTFDFQQNSLAQFSKQRMTQLLWKISIYFVHLHAQVLCSYLFQIFSQLFTWHFAYLNLFLARQNSGTISTVVANAVTDVSYFLHIHFWFYCPIAYSKIFPRFDFFRQHWGGVDRGDVNCGGGHNDYGVFNCGAVIVAQSLWRRHHHDGCCVIAAASNAAAVTVTIAAQWNSWRPLYSSRARWPGGHVVTAFTNHEKMAQRLAAQGGGLLVHETCGWRLCLPAAATFFYIYKNRYVTGPVLWHHCNSVWDIVPQSSWLL